MADTAVVHHGVAWHAQALYVRSLMRMLPLLINIFRHVSPKVQAEIDYLQPGFTFQLSVQGTDLTGTCRRSGKGSFKRVPSTLIARDVEPGSGKPSADPHAATVDYVIDFRSLPFAFRCFSGGELLKEALAERAFSTRGPNDAGVALTYLFTALLKMFFGWRAVYRTAPKAQRRTV